MQRARLQVRARDRGRPRRPRAGGDSSVTRTVSRILTTHVGSMPRPQPVVDMLLAQDRGEPFDQAAFDATMRTAVADTVARQLEAGVDIPSDGEMSKIGYGTYIRHRLSGFEGEGARPRDAPADIALFPRYRDRLVKQGFGPSYFRPVCRGPVALTKTGPLERGHREPACRNACRRWRSIHQRRIARCRRVLSSQTSTTPRKTHTSRRSRKRCDTNTKRSWPRVLASGGLPRSRDGTAHHLPQRHRSGVRPPRCAACRGSQRRSGKHPRGARADAHLLGELRGTASARHSARNDPSTRC